eukprot:m.419765 g.419765  ORF g.419765 m.419765 type:complete len:417 (-) comp56628_c0_seq1:283-1533(-)
MDAGGGPREEGLPSSLISPSPTSTASTSTAEERMSWPASPWPQDDPPSPALTFLPPAPVSSLHLQHNQHSQQFQYPNSHHLHHQQPQHTHSALALQAMHPHASLRQPHAPAAPLPPSALSGGRPHSDLRFGGATPLSRPLYDLPLSQGFPQPTPRLQIDHALHADLSQETAAHALTSMYRRNSSPRSSHTSSESSSPGSLPPPVPQHPQRHQPQPLLFQQGPPQGPIPYGASFPQTYFPPTGTSVLGSPMMSSLSEGSTASLSAPSLPPAPWFEPTPNSSFPDLQVIVICPGCATCGFESHNSARIKLYSKVSGLTLRGGELCDLCGDVLVHSATTSREELLKRRQAATAGLTKSSHVFHCHRCKQEFYRADRLLAHAANHSNKSAFQCDTCLELFQRKNRLSDHKKKVHPQSGST